MDEKLLFVIPAHNEEKNLKRVIQDLKKIEKNADIVIINDYSSDNTKNIALEEETILLDMPFNVGYSMAIQTGIKYAYYNNYDYVIQLDGDGQHVPTEVDKLLNKITETNADIVIGSRFLEETEYKHPFFRKVGTKFFQILIKIFCKKKITDPTSGFQCLNKKIIERYAKIGGYPEFPDANLIMEMLLEGYKIEEVSVIMKESNTGVSMHGGIYKPMKYMIKVTYAILFILIKNIGRRKNK